MMDEAQTRQEIIDQKLALAGWNVHDPSQVSQEFDIYIGATPTFVSPEIVTPYTGHQFADYLLLGRDGKPLAVVEAKRTSKDAEVGKEQALQYAQNIQRVHGGQLPLVMYTNGHEIYLWDSENYPPRKVHGFPTRTDLERLRFLANEQRPLSVELINTSIVERPYQIEAIRAVLEGVAGKRRKFLLVMATGTGKTRTCIGLIDALMRTRRVERVLFLVDRIALRDQARDAFKDHLPHAPLWPKTGEKSFAPDRRVYVATYPTALNLIENVDHYLSPHFFDLVIADESHRSIYNVYKAVLDYFDALQLGLTATPTDRLDHDTFKLFNYEAGDPTFAYTYEEAISHVPPYLCDFEVLNVRSKFQVEGIKGGALTEAEQKKMIAEGRDLEEIDFEGTDLEHKVTNSGTNRIIVREFMEECLKDSSGTLPGKSIFFAISKSHARRLEAIFDALYPEHHGKLARVIVSDDPRVYGKGGLLDQFKNQDMPRVAISVDMLDTGIDVREVVNLVFAKPVYSYTKFWQMIGRGTRILDDDLHKRQPWCLEKDRFLVIDCWNNFKFFQMEPKGLEPGQQIPVPVTLFRTRLAQLQAAIKAKRQDVIESAKAALRRDLAALPPNNVIVMDNQALLATTDDDQFWTGLKASDLPFLRTQIAPLLRANSGADFKAMRFEKEVIELSTALMQGNAESVETLKESLTEQVSELPLTVNVVARHKEPIAQAQEENFWSQLQDQNQDAKQREEKLHAMISRLAPLMRYRQRRTDPIVKLDLTDLLAVKEWVEFGPAHERLTTSVYRERLENAIRSLVSSNSVLQKLQQGWSISDAEVMALANLLRHQDPYVTEEILRKVYDHKTARFIQFIRHILGLEKLASWTETVERAFDDFIAAHNTFSTLQLRFIQTIKTFILQTGQLEKQHLIAAPFTQLHPQGIRGVFQPAQINEIMAFTSQLIA